MVPLIIGAAAASAAASIYGANKSAEASLDAARMAAEQEQKGLDFQKEVYNKSQENLSPYLQAGKEALGTYQQKLAGMQQPTFDYVQPEFKFSTYEDPGAKYQMQQAARALQASSLARGAAGGGFAKSLLEKSQEMAGTAYKSAWDRYIDQTKIGYGQAADKYARNKDWMNSVMDRYANLAKGGQDAAVNQGSQGANLASSVQSGYNSMGASLASGALGAAGSWNQGLTGATNALGQGVGAIAAYNKPELNNQLPDQSAVTRSNLGTGVQ